MVFELPVECVSRRIGYRANINRYLSLAVSIEHRKSLGRRTKISLAGDLVGTGLVASLARPGGNVTGLTSISSDLSGKRLELLKEAVPKA
jgi:hypothetical protein